MSTPASTPAAHPTRRARRIAEAGAAGAVDAARAADAAGSSVSAGGDARDGRAPGLPSVPPCTGSTAAGPAPLPSRRSLRGNGARAARVRTGRAGRPSRSTVLGPGRAAAVTATTLVASLVVGLGSPQVAVAGTPAHHAGRAADTAAAQSLEPSGLAPAFDGRDAYSVAGAARGDGIVVSGAVRPVDGTVPTAGGFGGRHVAGCAACSTDHHGLDFAAASGTPVHAVLPGVVVSAGAEGGYGLSVVVRHADGLATRSAHLSRIDARVGQAVVAGTVVGRVGSTGVSTGSHLHFEVLVRGTAIDPAPWLRARGLL